MPEDDNLLRRRNWHKLHLSKKSELCTALHRWADILLLLLLLRLMPEGQLLMLGLRWFLLSPMQILHPLRIHQRYDCASAVDSSERQGCEAVGRSAHS